MNGHMKRAIGVAVTCAVLLLAAAPVPRAQTTTPDPAAPFFDDSVVQSIYLEINSKDWNTLKTNYLDNTYYPVGAFKFNGATVRNVGIRSRGTGSRNPTKPGLRVDFDRYTSGQTFLGLKS